MSESTIEEILVQLNLVKSRIITTCAILTLLLSIPSLMRTKIMLPFLESEVRTKAPLAIEELRKEGIWVVNAELTSITKEDEKTCFHWEHRYTQRMPFVLGPKSEVLTTCL